MTGSKQKKKQTNFAKISNSIIDVMHYFKRILQ